MSAAPAQELRQRTGIAYITSYFFLRLHLFLRPKITPENFANAVFTLKTHQIFSVHTTPEESENTTITIHFLFVFEKTSGRETT